MSIFIFILIAITNITLLNFVIAILSNTYEKLTNLSVSVYLKFIIEQWICKGYDKNISSIVSAFPVLNILLMPFNFIVLVFWKTFIGKLLNRIILVVEFFPLMLIGIILFIIQEILLNPLGFVVTIFNWIIQIFYYPDKIKTALLLVVSIFFSPILFFFDSCGNIYDFIRSIWNKNLTKTKFE